METKQSSPTSVDSVLRLPSGVPELPADVLERFPSMREWHDELNKLWLQNTNAIETFAHALMDAPIQETPLGISPTVSIARRQLERYKTNMMAK